MRSGAHVKSVAALENFRAALGLFGDEVSQTLAALQAEIQAFVDWLEHDQLKFWRAEIRSREERVAEAKADLHRCLSATIDPQRTPSCHVEKKALDLAKKRLQEAEDKLKLVRRWIPLVRQAVMEYRMKTEPLRGAAASDVPAAAARLRSSIERLEEYLRIAPPSAAGSLTPDRLSESAAQPASLSGQASDDVEGGRQDRAVADTGTVAGAVPDEHGTTA